MRPATYGTTRLRGSDGALVAVVERADIVGDTCIAGPAGWVEPCDQSCTGIDSGAPPACVPSPDAGR